MSTALESARWIGDKFRTVDPGLSYVEPGTAGADRFFDDAILPLLETFHPEFEFRSLFLRSEGREVYRGIEGVREWMRDILAAFSTFERDFKQIEEIAPETVLACQDTHVVGRESGAEMNVIAWIVLRYRDGLLWRINSFSDRDEALREAGVAEGGN